MPNEIRPPVLIDSANFDNLNNNSNLLVQSNNGILSDTETINSEISALNAKVAEYNSPGDFLQKVSLNLIPGYSYISKFAANDDIDTGGYETIWEVGGAYNYLTSAELHNIASTSANDAGTLVSSGTITSAFKQNDLDIIVDSGATFVTDGVAVGDQIYNKTKLSLGVVIQVLSETSLLSFPMQDTASGFDADLNEAGDVYNVVTPASTGAAAIFIQGINEFGLKASEFVILNGLSNVSTVNKYSMMYRGQALFGGNNKGAVGTIDATASVSATISLRINNGNNQTLQSPYRISGDQSGYLIGWWATIGRSVTSISNVVLRAGSGTGFTFLRESVDIDSSASSHYKQMYPVWWRLPLLIDVFIEANASANNTSIKAGYDILLQDRTLQ